MKVELFGSNGFRGSIELSHVPRQGEYVGYDATLYVIEKVIYHENGINLVIRKMIDFNES